MAQPIARPKPTQPFDSRERLRARVAEAPAEHAEAVLEAFELLQVLHDRGVLDAVRSALAASDEILGIVVDQADTPNAIRAIRHLLFWRTLLGRIEPQWFQGIFEAIPDALAQATTKREAPVGLFTLLRRMFNRDSLRGLEVGVDFVESFGRHLRALEAGRAARADGK